MNNYSVDISNYNHDKDLKETLKRILWHIVSLLFFKYFQLRIFRKWRVAVLRLFGARIGDNCTIHSSVKIWAPWNMEIGNYVCIGPNVNFYNQGLIKISSNTTISQDVTLCASSHNVAKSTLPLERHFIIIEDQVWVASEAFIGPKVTLHQGSVVGARSYVYKDVEEWSIVSGNPAKFIKNRIIQE